jgi:hypothetical protein
LPLDADFAAAAPLVLPPPPGSALAPFLIRFAVGAACIARLLDRVRVATAPTSGAPAAVVVEEARLLAEAAAGGAAPSRSTTIAPGLARVDGAAAAARVSPLPRARRRAERSMREERRRVRRGGG